MKEKPIKRNENIVKLSQDHHASLLFCWKLRQGVKFNASFETMKKYVQYFWDHHFSFHFKEEEEFLFAPVTDEQVQKALDDHQEIKIFIEQINETGTEDEQDVLLELADLVDSHVRYEERILFPHLEKTLSDEQLKEIGKQISKTPVKDEFSDQFWIRPTPL
jgi:hemerythrin-like domain-containing protein